MAAKLNNPEPTGRWATFFEIIFGALAGVLFCAVWLTLKPVQVVDAPPVPAEDEAEVDRHLNYFVRGRMSARGAQFTRKQTALLERDARGVDLSEEEINRWINATYGRVDLSTRSEDFGAELTPNLPNVRLDGDRMQIGTEINVSLAGIKKTIVAQVRGGFVQREGGYEFVPERVMLGSCPLAWNFGGRSVYRGLMRKFSVPENLRAAWGDVKDIAIGEGRMRLGMVASSPTPVIVEPAPSAVVAPAETPAAVEPAPEVLAPVELPVVSVSDVSDVPLPVAPVVTADAPESINTPAPIAEPEQSSEPLATEVVEPAVTPESPADAVVPAEPVPTAP